MLMRWSKRSHRNNQIQIKKSFSNENQKAINTCKKLLLTILLIKISELPFVQFPRLINLKDPNRLANLPCSCSDDKSCIVFMHLVATELQHKVRDSMKKRIFYHSL